MARLMRSSRPGGESSGRSSRHRRWVVAIPLERERRLYFLATLVLAAWYLLDRLL